MKYLCLIYHDERQLGALGQNERDALVVETRAYDEELRRSGHHLASGALQCAETAMTIRVRGGEVCLADGPGIEAQGALGGFVLIEARDLNDAIRVAAKLPAAREGAVEVRPVHDPSPP